VKVIGYQSDMSRFAPDAQLAAITADWSGYYTRRVQAVAAGTWQPAPAWGGIKDGMVRLAAVQASLPAAVKSELAARERALVAGRDGPFHGRLIDQSGTVRQERGALGDDAIAKMDWFVQGVVGTLPRQKG
jgi:simple sugar transport system substrate-binding protein